jgi:D-3-phosphoglycerate dehydrogenase
MKILNLEPEDYAAEARGILSSLGEVVELVCSRVELLRQVADAEVLIVRLGHAIDAEVIQVASRLRVIVTATTGLNHIDTLAAQSQGIAVLSLRGERAFLNNITATAEHTWGLLLALVRNLTSAAGHVCKKRWDRDLFKGRQLAGLTLGVVGLGRLGSIVAEYARAFRMRVVAYDTAPVASASHVEMIPLLDLLACSDVVCLLPSYQPSSHRLISSREFALMKRNAVLVNTSRGEVLDEAALLHALRSGALAGAALDVLSGEGGRAADWLDSHPLVEFARESDRLLITPHIGGATFDSMAKAEVFMARKLHSFFSEGA